MTKTKSLLILIFTLLFSNYYLPSFTKEITITTYYPSPVGIYKELRAKRMAIGDNYYNPSGYPWDSKIPSDADLVVEGKVGIGTNDPEKELHVAGDTEIEGGVVIGNPTGGNKGIGTINAEKIYVNGSEVGGGECVIVSKGIVDNSPDVITASAQCPTGYTIKSACTGGSGPTCAAPSCAYENMGAAVFNCQDSPSHSCVGKTQCSAHASTCGRYTCGFYAAAYVRILCCK